MLNDPIVGRTYRNEDTKNTAVVTKVDKVRRMVTMSSVDRKRKQEMSFEHFWEYFRVYG